MTTHRYPVRLAWAGSTPDIRSYSRTHVVRSEGRQLAVSADPSFRGDRAEWNPELLLVAAASSCQLLSFLSRAARAGVDVVAYADDAEGVMPAGEPPVRITRIVLRPHITIRAGSVEDALRAVESAHEECYIANTLACDVVVEPRIEVV